MSDEVLRRAPELIRGGNGIAVDYRNGVHTISNDLSATSITPTDAAAPVSLADTLAHLIAHDTAALFITTIDDGFYDVPGTGGTVSADDGWF